MPVISITKTYEDGDILTEADLDAIREDVEDFFNVTKIDSDNIQDSGIETAKLQPLSITAPKIASDAVITRTILDGNVTLPKLDPTLKIPNTQAAILNYAVSGPYYQQALPKTGMSYQRLDFPVTLTSVYLFVVNAGSSGTLEVDVQYKRGGGAFTSIFGTKPSVAFGAGDYAVSSNAVLTTTALLTNDILRLDITGAQIGNTGFEVRFLSA
jgi:hypothetical protein